MHCLVAVRACRKFWHEIIGGFVSVFEVAIISMDFECKEVFVCLFAVSVCLD